MIEFKVYKKSVPTKVRQLTESDYQTRHGVIETREGPQPFSPGDYLAKDKKGEWPIKRTTLEQRYTLIEPEDAEGFESYLANGTVLAAQMPTDFLIKNKRGKALDFLVLGGNGGWPVDPEIFTETYRLVEDL
jgi:hypothetical protein